jgi:hypothetical protein
MAASAVPLRWTASDRRSVRLGALTGAAELGIETTDLDAAVGLLDALIEDGSGSASIAAADLATPDRDRAMAALLSRLAGDWIESTVECRSCDERFELSFSLSALVEHRAGSLPPNAEQVGPGRWEVAGTTFRFPTAHDERLAREADDPASVLGERCVGQDSAAGSQVDPANLALVEEAMATMAPVLASEIGGDCPECGQAHAVTFDVQRFTLALLRLGRDRLLRDVHIIASTYGWSRAEILGLERDERRRYVDMIGTRRRAGTAP